LKVLVTGINGFVGQHLKRELEIHGHDVRGLDVISTNAKVLEVNILDALRLNKALKDTGPDAVIHLAAIASVDHRDPATLYNVNFNGTVNLLNACKELEQKPCFLFISSSQVYGNVPADKLPIDETFPVNPVNHYGATKAAAEMAVMAFGAEYGLPYVIARPFNHTGPGQTDRFVVPKMINGFRERAEFIELGNIDTIRDFTDVRDVVKAYVSILENFISGNVYNVSSGIGVTVAEIFEMIKRISGHNMNIKKRELLVRGNEIWSVIGNSSLLRETTGWRPEILIERTLKDMLENYS